MISGQISEREQRSATLEELFARAGVEPSQALLDGYFLAWEEHTIADPDAVEVLRELRRRGIRIGVLSNTMWPRARHERIFSRDGLLDLIDGAVYSSEIPWTKPHPEAFRAAMAAVGVTRPRTASTWATGRSTMCTARTRPGCAPCSSRTATCRPSPTRHPMRSSSGSPISSR